MVDLNKDNIKGKMIMGEYRVEQSNLWACGGINPYTLTAGLGPGGLAHHEDSPRFDPTARSFAQGNKTWRSSQILVGQNRN